MHDTPPRVTLESRQQPCQSLVRWDNESLVLSVSFWSDDSHSEAPSTADEINQHIGIDEADYRLILGDIDLLLDSKRHLKSLEIRTKSNHMATWLLDSPYE